MNAAEIEPDLLSPWNELVRAYSADTLRRTEVDASRRAAAETTYQDALLNVGFFDVGEFNLCELSRLLNPHDYGEIVRILKDARSQIPHGPQDVEDALRTCEANSR